MKKQIISNYILSLFLLFSAPALQAGMIDLPDYGFEIQALDSRPGSAPSSVLMMFLPAVDGFSANVNIQLQPYTGSIAEYAALSKNQFVQMKWDVIAEKTAGNNEWIVEYKGSTQGAVLHFYARAIQKDGKIYLITATCQESQWMSVGETLRKNVDSFKSK